MSVPAIQDTLYPREDILMITINKGNIGEAVLSGEFDIAASVRSDEDSIEVKQVTLRFKLESTPLVDIVASSLKDKRINWQVGARTKFTSLKDHSIVIVDYKGGRGIVDPEAAMVSRLLAMTPEAREAKLRELSKLASSVK